MNTAVVVWAIFSMYDFKGPGTQLGGTFKTADECVKVAHIMNFDSVQGGGDLYPLCRWCSFACP
jgi:hypothetical protein